MHFTRKTRLSSEQNRMPGIASLTGLPEQSMRVLGVTIDKKLNWKAHIENAVIKAKRAEAAIRRITAATWGASLDRGRHLYIAMARPAMMYGCECWMAGQKVARTLIQQLETAQNRILRLISGAYKATRTQLLRWELKVEDITTYARRRVSTTMASQQTPRVREIYARLRARIQRKCEQLGSFQRYKGRPYQAPLQHAEKDVTRQLHQLSPTPGVWGKKEAKKAIQDRLEIQYHLAQKLNWESSEMGRRPFALQPPWEDKSKWRYKGLSKAQAAILIQARTEAIGLPAFLYRRKVPNASPRCSCGEIGTVRHYLAFCREKSAQRRELAQDTGTTDARRWLNEYPGKAAAWMIRNLPLAQFSWTIQHMPDMLTSEEGRGEGRLRGA